jgi:tRNA 5-methylaminomethyl-2-thiouridine biosynthesis bifunctional protein
VLANAADAMRLAGAAWPLQASRGQATLLDAHLPGLPRPARPVAGAGYALTLPDGRVLCGATSQVGDAEPALREADQAHNLAQFQTLGGWAPPPGLPLAGRVGWRVSADDRLPLLGPLPTLEPMAPRRLDQPRLLPREPGLWTLSALGSRGITQAPLAAELLAAWITGSPWPVPAALADRVDVARFAARGLRS